MSVRILVGDVIDRLRNLQDGSVHCCVTSPPYWGLRDYGVAGQIGMEPTYQEHIAALVAVFAEVRRVLRADGTLWLNYGDAYASTVNGRPAALIAGDNRTFRDKPMSTVGGALKPKDLCMLPHRLAIALQESGWWVRSDIVWHKSNPMPSSVKDRPTPAKEYVFLLTKSPRYYYDADAIREPLADSSIVRLEQDIEAQAGSARANGGMRSDRPMRAVCSRNNFRRAGAKNTDVPGQKPQFRADRPDSETDLRGRNKRDVWTIATEGFPGAHFATMPTRLAEVCILAGTSAVGVCPHCGAAWVPGAQTCRCPEHDPVPATVLDPFGGAGTTGLVADRLGRNALLVELNPAYAEIARERITADGAMFAACEVA